MSIAQSLIPEFDLEMATTRRVLERVPAAKFDWKAHEKSYFLGQVALHLANIPHWFPIMVSAPELDFATFPPPRYETPASLEQVLATFDKNVAEARAALAGASDEVMMGTWTGRTGEKIHFAAPRVAMFRSFVMSHSIHHRGQLSVYLRLLDVPVPAIYGPSADESNM